MAVDKHINIDFAVIHAGYRNDPTFHYLVDTLQAYCQESGATSDNLIHAALCIYMFEQPDILELVRKESH